MATRASHLQTNREASDIELVPTRNGFGEGLLEAGKRDKNVVAVCADLTESTRTNHFAETFPERFVQVGVAEQNMASVASGLAAMGKVPFMASYAAFSPGRNWEQIRTTIAYNAVNVKIVGAHAGISVGPDGATHQMTEDIALMRVMPNMVVIAPADVHEARKATLAAATYDGPVYIRLGRAATPVITTPESPFEIGRALTLVTKDDVHTKSVGIVVTGTLAHQAIVAAETLETAGVGASVLHLPTIKPLDSDALTLFAEKHQVIVTVEEHQIAGGLGSVVCEHLAAVCPRPVARVGVQDRFGESGEPDELLAHFGLDTTAIVTAAQALLT